MKLFAQLLLLSAVSRATLVPGPTGPYAVAMKVQALTDENRIDELNPGPVPEKRRVLFSMFLPIEEKKDHKCPVENVTYMTPGVAAQYGAQASAIGLPSDIFVPFELQLCNLSKFTPPCRRSKSRAEQFPVILFSPGAGDSRLAYAARAISLASRGYVVATVDHPYDADVVEFPDGTVIYGANISTDDPVSLTKLVKVRAGDLSFVLDQLKNNTILDPLVTNFSGKLDFSRVVAYGHSLGGATAATLARGDSRVRGGMDFDGQLSEPIMTTGLSKPFVLAGRVNHTDTDPTWNTFYPNLCGPRAQLAFNNTVHGSYLDIITLFGVLDIPDSLKPVVYEILGSVDAAVLDKAINGVLIAFFELVFRGNTGPLSTIGKQFSEVTITRSDLKRRGSC